MTTPTTAELRRYYKTAMFHPDQFTLVDHNPEDRQVLRTLFENEAKRAQCNSERIYRPAKVREHAEIRANLAHGFVQVDIDELLEAPILQHRPSDLDIQPSIEEHDETGHSNSHVHDLTGFASAEEMSAVKSWSDEAIVDLHHGLLTYSLGLLQSRGNAAEKRSILEWIWANDVHSFVPKTVQGIQRLVPVRADQLPFTFQTCCRLNGYHYEDVRDGLKWAMRDFLRSIGFKPAESN